MISAANVLETGIVLEARRGESAGPGIRSVRCADKSEQIVPVDSEQAEIARSAWRKYGKGRHPAGLNFGDCFAYALAKARVNHSWRKAVTLLLPISKSALRADGVILKVQPGQKRRARAPAPHRRAPTLPLPSHRRAPPWPSPQSFPAACPARRRSDAFPC